MPSNLLIPMIVILVIVVVGIGLLYFFTPAFKTPEQVCAEQGKIYDAQTDTCVSCSPKGSGCAFSQCCYTNQTGNYLPMSCNWDILAPLNLFRTCG